MKNRNYKYDLQYQPDLLVTSVLFVALAACSLQFLCIKNNIALPNIHILDLYFWGCPLDPIYENLIAWMLPVIVGIVTRCHFNYWKPISQKIFIRCNRYKFIKKRAFRSFMIGFCTVVLFYLAALAYLLISWKIFFGSIGSGVSLYTGISSLLPYTYYLRPIAYISFYILVASVYGGLFSLYGYAVSLYTRNKLLIIITPFVITLVLSLLFETMPHFGVLLSYNNAMAIIPARYSSISPYAQLIGNLAVPIVSLLPTWWIISRKARMM